MAPVCDVVDLTEEKGEEMKQGPMEGTGRATRAPAPVAAQPAMEGSSSGQVSREAQHHPNQGPMHKKEEQTKPVPMAGIGRAARIPAPVAAQPEMAGSSSGQVSREAQPQPSQGLRQQHPAGRAVERSVPSEVSVNRVETAQSQRMQERESAPEKEKKKRKRKKESAASRRQRRERKGEKEKESGASGGDSDPRQTDESESGPEPPLQPYPPAGPFSYYSTVTRW